MFRTRNGHLDYQEMPFGLINIRPNMQHLVNQCLKGYLDLCCIAYLDDILIYSDTVEEHRIHVKEVLHILVADNAIFEPEKHEF